MSRLNAPRAHPYDFRVVRIENTVYLYDDSVRTYICDQVPKLWLEPLYNILPEEWDPCPECGLGLIDENYVCTGECGTDFETMEYLPDGGYFRASEVAKHDALEVPLAEEEKDPGVSEKDAWDDARNEANANHLI